MRINGLSVWITGASSGIGAGLARALARRDCRLALFARSEERLTALRGELASTPGTETGAAKDTPPRILIQQGDVTDRERVREAVHEAEAAFGGLDVAILNAGIGEPMPADELDVEIFRRVLEVNLMGAVHGLEAALPAMLARRRGMIVGVSSIAGYRGLPESAPYCASKAALTTLLESLRLDLRPQGIQVLTVSPGFVKTPLTDRNRFPMPLLMPVERAADIIVRGMERGRRDIHFPLRLSLFMKCVRVLPVWLYDPVISLLRSRRRGPLKDRGA